MSDRQFHAVGTRPIRHDGLDKVTGRANYGADFSVPGMLFGAVLRSPYAHARIVSIDTSAAPGSSCAGRASLRSFSGALNFSRTTDQHPAIRINSRTTGKGSPRRPGSRKS